MSDAKTYWAGALSDRMPEPMQHEPSPFKKGRPPEPLQFEINLIAQAHHALRKPIP